MRKIFLLVIGAALFTACSGEKSVEVSETQDVAEAQETALTFELDTEASTIEWIGSKLLGSQHNGTIEFSNGSLSVEDGVLTAGNFVADMNTIKDLSLPEDGEYNTHMLVGHLKNEDFFHVEEHPTASFEITSIEAAADEEGNTHLVSGNMNIRGESNNITFPAKVNVSDDAVTLNADFVINRLDWGVSFNKDEIESFIDKVTKSGKDDFVKNEIELSINLIAN